MPPLQGNSSPGRLHICLPFPTQFISYFLLFCQAVSTGCCATNPEGYNRRHEIGFVVIDHVMRLWIKTGLRHHHMGRWVLLLDRILDVYII